MKPILPEQNTVVIESRFQTEKQRNLVVRSQATTNSWYRVQFFRFLEHHIRKIDEVIKAFDIAISKI